MGVLDRIVDKQKVRILRDSLTTDNAMLAIETALDKADESGNPLVGVITPYLRANERSLAELLNGFLLAYALGEDGLRGDGEDDVRMLMRLRIHRVCIGESMSKHPEWSRRHARQTVKLEITDERIIEAAKQVKRSTGMAGPPVEDASSWWQWIKDNWLTILSSLLPLLLMFI